jgi:hypothetical protein
MPNSPIETHSRYGDQDKRCDRCQFSPPCMSTEPSDPVTGHRSGRVPSCRQRSLTTCVSQSVPKSTLLRAAQPTYTRRAIAPEHATAKRVVPKIVRGGPQKHERPLRPSSTQESVAVSWCADDITWDD